MTTKAKFVFLPPANQQDFASDPDKQAALEAQWNTNLGGFTDQGIVGNPWTMTNASNQTSYFNPQDTQPPSATQVAPIEWNAFPGRIQFYYGDTLSADQQLELADTGYYTSGNQKQTFPPITASPCDSTDPNTRPYGPYGPRGWQDEYCEWSVRRDAKGNITRVDFTCENPEYWYTLWLIDPNKVLDLYRSTLDKPQIQLTDLYLLDAAGRPVMDPSTGRPAYNPLNKWNSGPFSTDQQGGAMHLTSTPNTLQTEINLGASATVLRNGHNQNPGDLICCSQYGQPHRNSDPNIGFSINQLVSLGNALTLTNPPGLYIQMPNFSAYETPDGSDASQYWTVVRGTTQLDGPDGQPLPGNFILHARFEVPKDKGFTVSDITIGGSKIQWAGQIAQTFNMHINGSTFAAPAPAPEPCADSASPGLPQPLQAFYRDVFWGYYNHPVENPVGVRMNLASNSTFVAPLVEQGQTGVSMVLTAVGAAVSPSGALPAVTFDGDDITAKVGASVGHPAITPINYATPGNTYPSDAQAISMFVDVSPTAKLGLRTVFLTNAGGPAGPGMPALINVVPAGTIQRTQQRAPAATLSDTSARLTGFSPPANQKDFPTSAGQAAFNAGWTTFISAATQQAIVGNPWTSTRDCDRAYYFDPLVTAPSGSPTPVQWGAFPNRLNVYFGTSGDNPYQLTDAQLWELADTSKVVGVPAFSQGFAKIPSVVCPAIDWSQPSSKWQAYGPPGPRGWMDEYCEWSVTRNTKGQITRIDFTCENPEYWLTAWRVDPQVVLSIYRHCVGSDVQLSDLYLLDETGAPVIDPFTGLPAYDPLNKWNRGVSSTASGGGAMHLTSPPNTLGAEIYLAAAATLLRTKDQNAAELICCAHYGQPFRNSDPNIGFSVNQLVKNLDVMITLTDPVGLYIQLPQDTTVFTFPEGYSFEDFFHVVRGHTRATPDGYDEVLHLTVAPPAAALARGITVEDVLVNGVKVMWGAQITETLGMALAATGIPSTLPKETQLACPGDADQPNPWPQGLMADTMLQNYLRVDGISELPPFLPPSFAQGSQMEGITLVCVDARDGATISFSGGIEATVTSSYPLQGSAFGTTKIYPMYAFVLTITVPANAPLGLATVQVVNPGVSAGPAAAGILNVVPAKPRAAS